MRYLDDYRDGELVERLVAQIHQRVTRPWNIMEVCGGQTHSILQNGLEQLLPPTLQLLHGPGCPVCVTPLQLIDEAIQLAHRPGVTLCSFGDMLRVPGSEQSLLQARSEGGQVKLVQSPLDALQLARQQPDREVVFFAVGFETTAPTTAMTALLAKRQGIRNFSLLTAHVLVPPALSSMLSADDHAIHGVLAAGHVCAVMGLLEYVPIAEKFRIPIVATGFEPVDILEGVLMCVEQLEAGRHEVENQYARAVREQGNPVAMEALNTVFERCDRQWRGIGGIPASGLGLSESFAELDAERRFHLKLSPEREPTECISGLVLQGRKRPTECPAFGVRCTPEQPLGAPMVSSEGACAAYFRHQGPPRTRSSHTDPLPRERQ
jgi:hydrogenase expression/formation protein HypD